MSVQRIHDLCRTGRITPSQAAMLRGIRHFAPTKSAPDGSKRKGGGVIELPYLDGVQHAAFPEVP